MAHTASTLALALFLSLQPDTFVFASGERKAKSDFTSGSGKTAGQSTTPGEAADSAPSLVRLQGSAEVRQDYNSNLAAWQASLTYRQGGAALSMQNFSLAAECFKQSGDGFERSLGECRFLAESRYAEAQSRRLLKQNVRAAELFRIAADLFRKCDPQSPFLQIAIKYDTELNGGKPLAGKISQKKIKLKALPPLADPIDRHIVLEGNLTQLADGTKIAALKDSDFFSGGKRLPKAASVNVGDAYVHDQLYKAFLKMTCLEFTALGGNYYTAPQSYKAFKANGKTVVIGASDDFFSPIIKLTLNGQQYGVSMDLPEMSQHSTNVLLVTDGQHVLAIDPRTEDTWKLVVSFSKQPPDFNWWKLTHTKKGSR